jgi:hypothetical protein
VARALEALALVAERDAQDRAWAHPARPRPRFARCCHGHLAGQLAVRVFDALQSEERLRSTPDGCKLTDAGTQWLQGLGMRPGVPSGRRRYAYRCLDWSERRDHLADEIDQHCTQQGWLRRATGRVVAITPRDQQELLAHSGASTA